MGLGVRPWRTGARSVDELPRSDRGKVKRDVLRELWLKANLPAQ